MTHINVVWKLAEGVQVGQALNFATMRLKEAEINSANLDAQVLLAHILGVDRSWLFAHHDLPLSPPQADSFTELIVRRMRHEPVAYLIGHKEFYGIDFVVDRRVLIPRPETELLVDFVLDEIALRTVKPVRIADVGTGSGAIALSIIANTSDAHVYAIDVSEEALEIAAINATRIDGNHQVKLFYGDLLEPLPEAVDIIVANLPYIASGVYQTLDPTVRDYEPRLALESGDDGLSEIRRLLQHAPNHLRKGGTIYLEIGSDQGAMVKQLVETILPQRVAVVIEQDYVNRDRIVKIVL